jgi:hypothetical protein
MSTAMATAIELSSVEVLKNQIIEKAWADPAFKQRLLSNPKAAIKDEFGIVIPDTIKLHTVEESTSEFYLVIPASPTVVASGPIEPLSVWV